MPGIFSLVASLSPSRRLALGAGAAAILAGAVLALVWAVQPRYEVLFRDLNHQDAGAVVAELEKSGVPYRVSDDGTSVLVPEGEQRAMRLKVMSGSIHLQGVAGLELFEHADLGLTEFAQKVNFQRALQGELARTIMSLDEVRLARVHLSLPEATLYRRDDIRPRASVAIFLNEGEVLAEATVNGIRRLVAAAVPQLDLADVAILDQHGTPAVSAEPEVRNPVLAQKLALEQYYARKIRAQIEPLARPAPFVVAVNAELDPDSRRLSRDEQVRVPQGRWRDGEADRSEPLPLPAGVGEAAGSDIGGARRAPLPVFQSSQEEKTARRLEETVSAPGTLRRLSVGILVERALEPAEQERVRNLVTVAAGLDSRRGDVVTVDAHERLSGEHASASDDIADMRYGGAAPRTSSQKETADRNIENLMVHASGLAALAVLICAGLYAGLRHFLRRTPRQPRLTMQQREEHVRRLRELLASGSDDAAA